MFTLITLFRRYLGLVVISTSLLSTPVMANIANTENPLKNNNAVANQIPEILYPEYTNEVIPELAISGNYTVGVRTMKISNPLQFDISTQSTKDRLLTLEIWYPASSKIDGLSKTSYENETRLGHPFSIQANAYRDVDITGENENTYPVIILSHGYTGYRTIMFYLGEHLASHGYIVAAIDHTDSTNEDVDFEKSPFSGFPSTLLNRSRDQQFTLDYLVNQPNFLSKVIDKENSGLIGYSMGGFGAVNTLGGCYNFNDKTGALFTGIKEPKQLKATVKLLNSCAGGQYDNITVDKTWKAAIAFAPWGAQHQLFSKEGLSSITTPMLYISGSLDDVSQHYGVESLFNTTGKTNNNHTFLLTFENARHNIAPHPAPKAAFNSEIDLGHYYDASWSNVQLNFTSKHFSLAMMDCYVKNQNDKCEYLNLPVSSNQLPVESNSTPPWKGFDNRYSTGMRWHKR